MKKTFVPILSLWKGITRQDNIDCQPFRAGNRQMNLDDTTPWLLCSCKVAKKCRFLNIKQMYPQRRKDKFILLFIVLDVNQMSTEMLCENDRKKSFRLDIGS